MEIKKQFLVTVESVASAAESIQSEGGKPSVRSVIARIGGGSPNVVCVLLNRWRESKPVVESRKSIFIDERIAALIADQTQKAVTEAAASANEQRISVDADMQLIAVRGAELEQQAAADADRIAAFEAAKQHDLGVIESLQAAVVAAKTQATLDVDTANAAAGLSIEKAEKQALNERARADLLVSDLGAANAKISALQEHSEFMKSENERIRSSLADAQQSVVTLEKGLAVSESKLSAAQASAADYCKKLDASTKEIIELRIRLISEEQCAMYKERENSASLKRITVLENSLNEANEHAYKSDEECSKKLNELRLEIVKAEQSSIYFERENAILSKSVNTLETALNAAQLENSVKVTKNQDVLSAKV